MQAETRIIHGSFKDGTAVDVTLSKADLHIGMRRSRLISEAQQANQDEQDIDMALLRFLYADVAAATISVDRHVDGAIEAVPVPLSFETFCDLSDTTGAQLEQTIYQLNSHWIGETKQEREDPKG